MLDDFVFGVEDLIHQPRPLNGETPTIDLVVGYHKLKHPQFLRTFLSKMARRSNGRIRVCEPRGSGSRYPQAVRLSYGAGWKRYLEFVALVDIAQISIPDERHAGGFEMIGPKHDLARSDSNAGKLKQRRCRHDRAVHSSFDIFSPLRARVETNKVGRVGADLAPASRISNSGYRRLGNFRGYQANL